MIIQAHGGVKASTTGNVTGIYDVNGGSWERAAGYVNNGNSSLTSYGQEVLDAPIKHKQIYITTTDSQSENYNNTSTIFGDAIYETSSNASETTAWNADYSVCFYSNGTFSSRGGGYSDGYNAGVFSFSGTLR